MLYFSFNDKLCIIINWVLIQIENTEMLIIDYHWWPCWPFSLTLTCLNIIKALYRTRLELLTIINGTLKEDCNRSQQVLKFKRSLNMNGGPLIINGAQISLDLFIFFSLLWFFVLFFCIPFHFGPLKSRALGQLAHPGLHIASIDYLSNTYVNFLLEFMIFNLLHNSKICLLLLPVC